MSREEIILVGGGGHCHACIDVLEAEDRFRIAGIVDRPEKVGETVLGYPVIGSDQDLPKLAEHYPNFLVTLGQIKSASRRISLCEEIIRLGGKLPTIVSPLAYVSRHATVGNGSIIMHRALVNAGAGIGANCIINSCALIEHDAKVEDNCHISTGAIVNGGTRIAAGTFIGSNAVTREAITVGGGCIVAAGAGVMRDLPPDTTYKNKS